MQLAWNQIQPQVSLNFVYYDCYKAAPDPNIDVFAFDCIFADDFAEQGVVDPIDWSAVFDPGDLFPFAVQCADLDSKLAVGIPYLGCTNVLFYRAGDPGLDNTNPLGVDDLAQILGPATYPGPAPPPKTGLIMDLGGKTTDACIYANLVRQEQQSWWPTPFPTTLPPNLDPEAMSLMRAYATMVGRAGATWKDDSGHDRTNWFQTGLGRASVGLTETMSAWPPGFLDLIKFRPMPTAAKGNATKLLCFADALGIRKNLGDKRDLAIQLANTVASVPVLLAALNPSPTPQYLIPARQSVMSQLLRTLPKYQAISDLLASWPLSPFRLGPGVMPWTQPAGLAIIAQLFPGLEEGEQRAEEEEPVRHHLHHTTPAGIWRRGE